MATALEGTRLTILNLLRSRGSATVEELAREIGLAGATIRRHLDILQRDQLVASAPVRRKAGRPEFAYRLTEQGQESGFRDYHTLLSLLMRAIRDLDPSDLADTQGDQLLRLVMDRVSFRLSTSYSSTNPAGDEPPLEQLERVLTQAGFSPQVFRENGLVRICLCNCPFRSAALVEEAVCLFDRRLIAGILGTEPEREATIRDGHGNCTYVAPLSS